MNKKNFGKGNLKLYRKARLSTLKVIEDKFKTLIEKIGWEELIIRYYDPKQLKKEIKIKYDKLIMRKNEEKKN